MGIGTCRGGASPLLLMNASVWSVRHSFSFSLHHIVSPRTEGGPMYRVSPKSSAALYPFTQPKTNNKYRAEAQNSSGDTPWLNPCTFARTARS